ncbi:MAG: membrane protein insertase YidC [Deltaproteobacteria bacterium]|nr:membrane protein insertase YidC [Deltaproteobacteria bacterium]
MNENNRRLFLTIALCMVATYLWGVYFAPKKPVKPADAAVTAGVNPAAVDGKGGPAELAKPGDVPRGTPAAAAAPGAAATPTGTAAGGSQSPRPPTKTVVLESERLKLRITSDGAALESVELKGPKFAHKLGPEKKSVQLDLVDKGILPLPLTTTLKAQGQLVLPPDAGYEVEQPDAWTAVFTAHLPTLTVKKTLALDPQTYRLNLKVETVSTAPLAGELLAEMVGNGGTGQTGGMFSPGTVASSHAVCRNGKDTEKLLVGAKSPSFTGNQPAFAGISQPYFISAVVPELAKDQTASCELLAVGSTLTAGIQTKVVAQAEQSATQAFIVYLGPKDADELAAVSPQLHSAIDLGFWSIIAQVLLTVMKQFYKLVPPHNWGIAIILLTLSVKLLTFPLQAKSMKSMQEMARIQPQLDELKVKYAGDQQRQNMEQMKLFKEHGVNPMGSCLPMLIQMPVWLALYTTLQNSVELYNSVFIAGWLDDLTAKDPYYIVPVAMGITMILTQVLTPQPMSNPSQKYVGYVVSGFFSLMMLNLPSGLTLYIVTNNVLSILQQVYLRRTFKIAPRPAAETTIATTAR